MQTLTRNDADPERPTEIANWMHNLNSMSWVKCIPSVTEEIINDVYTCIKYHDENKIPLPPTACFKANSLIMFA